MPVGDISKGLVARVRSLLHPELNEQIKSDILIYDKLNFYQNYIMTVKLVSRIKVEYPLINNQSEYPFLQNVVQHTTIWFNSDIQEEPLVTLSSSTSGDDARKFFLSNSDTFRNGTDFMYSQAFVRPFSNEKISSSNDPIIEDIYHELLIEYVRDYFLNSSPVQLIMKHTEDIAQAMRSVNRFEPIFNRALTF